jgi:hypothetical protein
MIGAEREHKITVWNESHTVTIYQKSKSVWIAVGDYIDQRIETKGSSAGSALNAWKDAATYRGG